VTAGPDDLPEPEREPELELGRASAALAEDTERIAKRLQALPAPLTRTPEQQAEAAGGNSRLRAASRRRGAGSARGVPGGGAPSLPAPNPSRPARPSALPARAATVGR
jgi:hypothetical protein